MSKVPEEETKKEQRVARKLASKRDRSKYKKTDYEKRMRLQKEEAEKRIAKKSLLRGRVLAILADEVMVEHDEKVYVCVLRGVLKKEFTRVKNLVTVGDFVLFEPKEGSIAHVEERVSILSRRTPLRRQQQLIAANIDQVLITVSVLEPPLKPALVDRYIIATFRGNMKPVIVLNKIDLLQQHKEEKAFVEAFIGIYSALKLPVIALSAKTKEGIETLKKQMQNKASVFSGQSGTGKSSLINAATGLSLPVGGIAKKSKKGAHTTTTARLIPLEFGGWCIDTPGIQSFGMWDLERKDLDTYFPEIREIGSQCKYANCTHTHEPNCAVIQAVKEKKITPLRFKSYLKLLEELDSDF